MASESASIDWVGPKNARTSTLQSGHALALLVVQPHERPGGTRVVQTVVNGSMDEAQSVTVHGGAVPSFEWLSGKSIAEIDILPYAWMCAVARDAWAHGTQAVRGYDSGEIPPLTALFIGFCVSFAARFTLAAWDVNRDERMPSNMIWFDFAMGAVAVTDAWLPRLIAAGLTKTDGTILTKEGTGGGVPFDHVKLSIAVPASIARVIAHLKATYAHDSIAKLAILSCGMEVANSGHHFQSANDSMQAMLDAGDVFADPLALFMASTKSQARQLFFHKCLHTFDMFALRDFVIGANCAAGARAWGYPRIAIRLPVDTAESHGAAAFAAIMRDLCSVLATVGGRADGRLVRNICTGITKLSFSEKKQWSAEISALLAALEPQIAYAVGFLDGWTTDSKDKLSSLKAKSLNRVRTNVSTTYAIAKAQGQSAYAAMKEVGVAYVTMPEVRITQNIGPLEGVLRTVIDAAEDDLPAGFEQTPPATMQAVNALRDSHKLEMDSWRVEAQLAISSGNPKPAMPGALDYGELF